MHPMLVKLVRMTDQKHASSLISTLTYLIKVAMVETPHGEKVGQPAAIPKILRLIIMKNPMSVSVELQITSEKC